MPVFLAISMGTIETCRMMYLQQSLEIAAYECCRLAIVPGITQEDVQDQGDVILYGRGIDTFVLETSADPQSLSYGDLFTTTVSVNATDHTIVGGWFYSGKTLTETVSIMAEY